MPELVEIRISPKDLKNHELILQRIEKQFESDTRIVKDYQLHKRSIDSRQKKTMYVLQYQVYFEGEEITTKLSSSHFINTQNSEKKVHIIGAGPAGYFAALYLIKQGYRPIIYERGKNVRERRRDLKAIQQDHIVHPESNYCFGEGGAGTYSDGKLYTRSGNKKKIKEILALLVEHGATKEILIDAHPHIGSNKLPKIIENIRQTIETYGGEVHFNSKLEDIFHKNGKIERLVVNQTEIETQATILATGHSARDIFQLLHRQNIRIEFKPFALGVRIEHPQELINQIQYADYDKNPDLPAASYSLVCQHDQNGVYSFCMCPGGLIVPSATNPEEIVLNGMSPSRRDSKFANSGFVVSVEDRHLMDYQNFGAFRGMEFQKLIEQNVFKAGDGSQRAPAQRLTDFVRKSVSTTLPDSSYIPGIYSYDLKTLLPVHIYEGLQFAIQQFDRKMKGFLTEEATILAVESRTSSPIRIPRDLDTGMHHEVKGLFPCGEGAGYAGGIVSAALDGRKMAESVVKYLI